MTVRELIAKLMKEDPDRVIVMPDDGSYSLVFDITQETYRDKTGEIGIEVLTPKLEEEGCTEDDVVEGDKALVFWPEDYA